jgi:hypothetical protein
MPNLSTIISGSGSAFVSPGRSISAGSGLTGGGDLSADRTISLDTGSYPSNTYLTSTFSSNTYLQTTLGSYTSNTYASNTFISHDTIYITTPTAATEYDLFRFAPRNKDYREAVFSTQFGSANVGLWVGGTLVANVTANTTNQTVTFTKTAAKGDRIYVHLWDAAIANTSANLEFSFGGV